MAKSPLESALKEYGCETPIKQFQDALEEVFNRDYRARFTVDSLMQHPSDAVEYCQKINKYQSDFAAVPENLILRCLMARRKNPV